MDRAKCSVCNHFRDEDLLVIRGTKTCSAITREYVCFDCLEKRDSLPLKLGHIVGSEKGVVSI